MIMRYLQKRLLTLKKPFLLSSRLSSGVRSSLSKQRDLEPAPPGGISIDDALNNVEERMRKLVEEEGSPVFLNYLLIDYYSMI